MGNIQVKNVPEDVHQALRDCAARRGQTIREVVLQAIRREISQEAFLARLRRRPRTSLRRPAGELLEEARAERDAAR